jgi:TonB family protein
MRNMKLTICALLFTLSVLNSRPLIAQQTSTVNSGFKHHETIKIEYDKFKDETKISLLMRMSSSRGEIKLYVMDSNKGPKFEPSGHVGIGFLSDGVNWLSDIYSKFYLLADGERFQFHADFSEANGRIALVPYQTFVGISRAKKVEGKIGVIEFELNNEQLEALRDLASRMDVYVDTTRIYKASEVSQGARITSQPSADYTPEARKNQITGEVVLRVVLNGSGKVSGIDVIRGLSHGLTEKAIEAARKISFKPALKAGQAVSVSLVVSYPFNLY